MPRLFHSFDNRPTTLLQAITYPNTRNTQQGVPLRSELSSFLSKTPLHDGVHLSEDQAALLLRDHVMDPTKVPFVPSCRRRARVAFQTVALRSRVSVDIPDGSSGFFALSGVSGGAQSVSPLDYIVAANTETPAVWQPKSTNPVGPIMDVASQLPCEPTIRYCIGGGEMDIDIQRTDLYKNYPAVRIWGGVNGQVKRIGNGDDDTLQTATQHQQTIYSTGRYGPSNLRPLITANFGDIMDSMPPTRSKHIHVGANIPVAFDGRMIYREAKDTPGNLLDTIYHGGMPFAHVKNDTGAPVTAVVASIRVIAVRMSPEWAALNTGESVDEPDYVPPLSAVVCSGGAAGLTPVEAINGYIDARKFMSPELPLVKVKSREASSINSSHVRASQSVLRHFTQGTLKAAKAYMAYAASKASDFGSGEFSGYLGANEESRHGTAAQNRLYALNKGNLLKQLQKTPSEAKQREIFTNAMMSLYNHYGRKSQVPKAKAQFLLQGPETKKNKNKDKK